WSYRVGSAPTAVVARDFNGDGQLDLAVANFGAADYSSLIDVPFGSNTSDSNTVSVLLGRGFGTFQPAQSVTVGSQPPALVAADFNGDGRLDLATANMNSNDVSVILGNGDGTFRAGPTLSAGQHPVSLVLGDFNGDNRLDLAAANAWSDDVSLFLSNG